MRNGRSVRRGDVQPRAVELIIFSLPALPPGAHRANPVVVTPSQESLALKQLSLAHRKLSALLDSTEGELNTRTAELVNCQAFLVRAQMETDDIKDAQAQQHSFNQELQDRLVQETTLRRQAEVDRDLWSVHASQTASQAGQPSSGLLRESQERAAS